VMTQTKAPACSAICTKARTSPLLSPFIVTS
jgi:hypothetical protein